ncbi:hypothetical protein FOCC_FOCC018035 [Frankliniella occidentalis]|nr:hypothetical protein FOCC_FOCC018035 [Frankliniella occidentalis]
MASVLVCSMAVRQLTPELEERAKQELGEDPARRQEDINAIKTWLSKQGHLNANTEDQWILTFLRGCKFSLERTKEKIDSYYTFRTLLPEFFTNRDPMLPEMQEILNLGICFPLPHPDPKGRKIFLMRVGNYDPSKIKLQDIMKLNYINMDITLRVRDARRSGLKQTIPPLPDPYLTPSALCPQEDDRPIICGDVLIMDMRGVTLGHLAQVQPSLLKRASTVYQDAYPVRPQGMHYVYAPSSFESILGLIKSFMKEKLRKRVSIRERATHGDAQCRVEDQGGEPPGLAAGRRAEAERRKEEARPAQVERRHLRSGGLLQEAGLRLNAGWRHFDRLLLTGAAF